MMSCCFGFVAASDGSWIDDGSGAVQAKGGSFEVKGKPQGDSPVNARFSKALTSGAYFEVKAADLRGSAFVGVATEEGFKKGYAAKGLFFGGNLSNGSGLVRSKFGDCLAKGDVIGVLFESCRILSPIKEETVTVTFYQNGRCLGPAFVSRMATPGAAVYPVVKAGTEGDKFLIRFTAAPKQRLRENKSASPYEGDWTLRQMMVGPELGEYPLAQKMGDRSVTFNIEATAPSNFRVSAKVANTLTFNVTTRPNTTLKPFDEFMVNGPCMSTRLMGTPAIMEVEQKLQAAVGECRKWLARPDHGLLLSGPTAELSLERCAAALAPEENTPLP
eukprot:TRINITY_DN55961_c0_g1_i1.p1 TRINITY_DN55961_c0_g1~~TRINITY_DN55961_c0_g1_i1.p1  ORF type:complete len:353 (-),score=79.82 TRINITY_DN55961_c0_g1_i1:116-1108(-)